MDRDTELHGVQVVETRRKAGVEQQTLLHRGQRQHVNDPVLPAKVIDLLLAEPRREDVGQVSPPHRL